ncbi:hypothetical protein [Streptomyces qinglanensis]|uniref:hypothetical protein n=1 Tax=Streptomyces qinglanensis TaxID=943816 RepID=UPI003D715B5D
MSVEHSFYLVYGVELGETDWLAVGDALEELRRSGSVRVGEEGVELFTVGGSGGMPGSCSVSTPRRCRPVSVRRGI